MMSGMWVRRRQLVENYVGATASQARTFTVSCRTTASVAVRCVEPLLSERIHPQPQLFGVETLRRLVPQLENVDELF